MKTPESVRKNALRYKKRWENAHTRWLVAYHAYLAIRNTGKPKQENAALKRAKKAAQELDAAHKAWMKSIEDF